MTPLDLSTLPRPAARDRLDVRDLTTGARTDGEVVGDQRAELGERPLWDARTGTLVWVDIDGRAVHRWADADPDRDGVLSCPSPVGLAWPAASGGLLLATADGLGVHDGTRLGPLTRPDGMPADYRFNDGACDGAGRLWITTMPRAGVAGDGVVHRVVADPDPDAGAGRGAGGGALRVDTPVTGVGLGNGLAWSPDGGTLYLTDTAAGVVFRMPYDVGTGEVGTPEPFLALADGGPQPDGTTVDADGGLWVALYGGGHVLRFAADGTPLGAYAVPTPNVTCAGFGAPGSGDLFVTTASTGGSGTGGDALPGPETTEQRLGGAVLRFAVDVDGSPVRAFQDVAVR
ncbi:SMP-30/gluconolactonase/LRE family protein [Cellulomonas sp. NPDC058312]|uniref:SMP-30/gluconolactonase/LRE family protein n=1 Tax=Cellulomonas sp. NPDC058312 TaxID=3346441 RepID=UPI0036EB790A